MERELNRGEAVAVEPRGEPEWVDRDTALRYCPVSYTTLWRLSKEKNGIRTTRIGRRVFFDLRSIREFMESKADAS